MMANKKSSPQNTTPPGRKRISFSISSDPDTVEGRVIDHLRNNKMVNMRESVIRALKAYYLPWAYEDDVSKEEAQVLARNAIDELEFRIFQIRRHFLAGEAYGPRLSESLAGNPVAHNGGVPPVPDVAGQPGPNKTTTRTNPLETSPASLPEMLDDADIDPDVLDDF
ncbi:MAG: hypothetical protein AAF243_06040 [Cyanobacteria bacterium P01_A01_bin.137]